MIEKKNNSEATVKKFVKVFDEHLGMGEAEIVLLFIPAAAVVGAILFSNFL